MSTKIIPEQKIVTCDGCEKQLTNKNHVHGGKLHVTRHALDMQGHAVASNDVNLDLCDSCVYRVSRAINVEFGKSET